MRSNHAPIRVHIIGKLFRSINLLREWLSDLNFLYWLFRLLIIIGISVIMIGKISGMKILEQFKSIVVIVTALWVIPIIFKSIRKSLFYSILYLWIGNLLLSLAIADFAQAIVSESIATIISILSYPLLWVFYSLLCEDHIGKLANEIVGGFLAFIFTVGTFMVSMISDFEFGKWLFSSNFTLVESIQQNIQVIGYQLNLLLSTLLLGMGLSVFSIAIINIKLYWEEKYNQDVKQNNTN